MRFGKTLQKSVYSPWKDKYIDYNKLKQILRESEETASGGEQSESQDEREWTERDVENFTFELINVQLEKVNNFHLEKFTELQTRSSECQKSLDQIASGLKKTGAANKDEESSPLSEERSQVLNGARQELDSISKELKELESYSRINYTGFLKACKKHDRRTEHYKVRHVLLVRLAMLPFNQEDYSPLLFRLATMYSFVRQNLGENTDQANPFADKKKDAGGYQSHKFWVHSDNLTEVKLVIMRYLPQLVYTPQGSKFAEMYQRDPRVNSIYFDNRRHDLYTEKVEDKPNASSLRLRWYGCLDEDKAIEFEKKTLVEGGISTVQRFPIKPHRIQSFIQGEQTGEGEAQTSHDQASDISSILSRDNGNSEAIQSFIQDYSLQPVLRANYARAAFEIPGDAAVRISLDTDLVLIREDSFNRSSPSRDADQWHRKDIDKSERGEVPFSDIRKSEINRFPHGVLEIKTRGKKRPKWVSELMNSHLVTASPHFSKFVHGVSTLMDDRVAIFPFWLPQLETDIRKDPQQAFEEEQKRKERRARDEMALGSLTGRQSSPFQKAVASPYGSPRRNSLLGHSTDGNDSDDGNRARRTVIATQPTIEEEPVHPSKKGKKAVTSDKGKPAAGGAPANTSVEDFSDSEEVPDYMRRTRLQNLFPTFNYSKYSRNREDRLQNRARRASITDLPDGVTKPDFWLKDQGAVKVEPKVWLANQRTFVKWQHISLLLGSLALALFNSAGAAAGGDAHGVMAAKILGTVYVAIAGFASWWGWSEYMRRRDLIAKRSGEDLSNMFGPLFVCFALAVALVVNFVLRYRAVMMREGGDWDERSRPGNVTGAHIDL